MYIVGETVAYLNLSRIFPTDTTIDEGHYDENEAIRAATIAQKFKTISLVVYKKFNATTLHFQLKGKSKDQTAIEVVLINYEPDR